MCLTYLSDGVGVVVLHDGGCVWAVGGILGDDLSGGILSLVTVAVSLVTVAVSRDGSNVEGSSENRRGTHFEFEVF